jgi:hypothetical protein
MPSDTAFPYYGQKLILTALDEVIIDINPNTNCTLSITGKEGGEDISFNFFTRIFPAGEWIASSVNPSTKPIAGSSIGKINAFKVKPLSLGAGGQIIINYTKDGK